MKKFTLSLIAGLLSLCCAPFAQAAEVPAGETDITTLPWVNKGQGCASDFNNDGGSTVYGTDAGLNNADHISYVDLSAYGVLKLYGTAGQKARLFLNREEVGDDAGTFTVEIGSDGVATFDFNKVLDAQPRAQYIHLNGVKSSAWNTNLNLSMITVSGDPITFPEIKTLPADEIDITTLPWVNEGQGITNNLGAQLNNTIFGTDAGPSDGKLSYVDVTNYGTIKFYGRAGDALRLFINRAEFPSDFTFNVTLDEDGIGIFNIASVYAKQDGIKYVHLNGVKTNWCEVKIDLIGLTEKDFEVPEGEVDITTLTWNDKGFGFSNNFGVDTDATTYGTDAGPSGENLSYVDITNYSTLKLYGRAKDVVRLFINRAENPDDFQYYVTIGDDGVGTFNLAEVYDKHVGTTYVHLNGAKPQYQVKVKVKGITLSGEKSLFAIHTTGTLTADHAVNHIAKNADNVWAANSINLDESCEYLLAEDVLAAEVNYLREVTSNTWSTICLPFAVPASALIGYDVLTLKGIEGDNVVFEYLDETEGMEGHTPYLIRTDSNKLQFNLTGEVTIKASDDAIANGTGVQLVGIYKAQRVPEGCYALASGEFHKAAATNENELKPYRAYLQTVSAKQMLKVAINGATSAIEGIEVAEDAKDGVFYNLKGQKVNNPTTGVYILNGVKVIVK